VGRQARLRTNTCAWYKHGVNQTAIATCENHLQREAIGVCVQCRTRVCSECSTKVDGINYCVRCLQGLARQRDSAEQRTRAASGKAAYLAASGYLLLLSVAVWALFFVLLPGR
jgi:hypothetical protein